MASIFDRWTDLDPALALRRIEAAYGSGIFDRDSYTDPQRALRQIESAFGVELDDAVGLLNPSSLEDAIDEAIEAGSSPDWVPDNAKIYIDFVNDRAWTEADGEVAINTLLGADANTENAVGLGSGYDTGQLVADGYRFYDAPSDVDGIQKPAFIGALITALLAGCTIRIAWLCPGASGSGDVLQICSADGNNELEYYYTKTDPGRWFKAESWAGGYGTITIDGIINKGTSTSLNSFALTVTSTRSEIAVNGSEVNAGVLVPATHWNDLAAAIVTLGTDDILVSITIYDALPSTAGLSALSETGVEAEWTPANLGAALIGWYEADAGVYVDAGVTPATNGQSVQQWNDQSGTGNHLTQAASGNRPVYTTGLLNGLPGIVFDHSAGDGGLFINQAISLGGVTASVFIVAKQTLHGAVNGRFVTFIETGYEQDYGVAGSAVFLFALSATEVLAYRTAAMSGGTIVDDTFTQLGSIFDGANNTVYIDGVAQTPAPMSYPFGATGSINIGGDVNAPLDGTICEIIFTNIALDVTDRGLLQTYLTAKWGV